MIVYGKVEEMEEAIKAFNKAHTDARASMAIDPIESCIRFKICSITSGRVPKAAVQLVPFYKIEALNIPPKDLVDMVLGNLYEELKPETSMDLYDAIDLTEKWLTRIVQSSDYCIAPSAEEYEAIKICLEAARDKAGV